MKKIVLLAVLILSQLSISKEIEGYTSRLTQKDKEEILKVSDPNEYLEKMYPNSFFAEEIDGKIHVYPRIEYVKINSEYHDKAYIENILPSIYVGKIVRDSSPVISYANSEILKDNPVVNIYARYSIDAEGRYGVIVDELNKTSRILDISATFGNLSGQLGTTYIRTGFNDNDIFKASVDYETPNILEGELLYNVSQPYKEKDFSLKVRASTEGRLKTELIHSTIKRASRASNFTFMLRNNYEFEFNKIANIENLALKAGIVYEYSNRNTVNMKYKGNIQLNTSFEGDRKANVFLENNLKIFYGNKQKATFSVDTHFKYALFPQPEDNKLRYRLPNKKYKEVKGDIVGSLNLELTTVELASTYGYSYFDLISGMSNGKNEHTIGGGVGIRSKRLPVDIDGYMGFSTGNQQKHAEFLTGLSLKYRLI